MMSKVDFQWELTEENFRRMMAEEQTPDIFGDVRFGKYLVEFRCTGGGYEDDYHVPTTDIYIYGEEGIEEYSLRNGVPYRLLDEELAVPKRRSLDGFKKAFEQLVMDSDFIQYRQAVAPTLSDEAWNPQEKEVLPYPTPDTIRIPTMLGDIVVASKEYGAKEGYPGVWVGIERKGQRFDVAMIEVDQEFAEEDGEEPLLECHVYCTDPAHDDPIYDYYANAAEIDEFLKDNE